MPMVTKLNFKLCVLSSVSMRGTHDCAIDLNSVLGYSIKPIFTGSDAIGDLTTWDLVAILRRQWREREKTTLYFLLEIPTDSLNVNEKGRPKVPPPSTLGSMPSLCMNEQWPSLTPSACQSLCWRSVLVSRAQEKGKMAPAVCRRSLWNHKGQSCTGLRLIRLWKASWSLSMNTNWGLALKAVLAVSCSQALAFNWPAWWNTARSICLLGWIGLLVICGLNNKSEIKKHCSQDWQRTDKILKLFQASDLKQVMILYMHFYRAQKLCSRSKNTSMFQRVCNWYNLGISIVSSIWMQKYINIITQQGCIKNLTKDFYIVTKMYISNKRCSFTL